jgi:hypothetical protein
LKKIVVLAGNAFWGTQEEYVLLQDVPKAFSTDPAEGLLEKANARSVKILLVPGLKFTNG